MASCPHVSGGRTKPCQAPPHQTIPAHAAPPLQSSESPGWPLPTFCECRRLALSLNRVVHDGFHTTSHRTPTLGAGTQHPSSSSGGAAPAPAEWEQQEPSTAPLPPPIVRPQTPKAAGEQFTPPGDNQSLPGDLRRPSLARGRGTKGSPEPVETRAGDRVTAQRWPYPALTRDKELARG